MAQDWTQYQTKPVQQNDWSQFQAASTPVNEPKVVESTELPQQSKGIGLRNIAAMGIRGVSSFVPGGPIGAVAGGVGEGLAQLVGDEEFNPTQIGVQSALGFIPFGRVASVGRGMMKGAALGTGGKLVTDLADGELSSPEELALSAGIGAIGGGISGRASKGRDIKGKIPIEPTNVNIKPNERLIDTKSLEPFDAQKALDDYRAQELLRIENRPPAKKTIKALGNTLIDKETGEVLSTGSSKLEPESTIKPMFRSKNRGETVSGIKSPEDVLKSAVDSGNVIPPNKPPSVPPVPMDKVPDEIIRNNNLAKQMPDGPAKESLYAKVSNAQRALLTSFDVSAPGRQGLPRILNKEFWTSLDDMVKAWGSEKSAKLIDDSIYAHPNFGEKNINIKGKGNVTLAEAAGLKLANTKDSKEEVFRSQLAEKLPLGIGTIVQKSERAYTAFLNKLRSDYFNRLVDKYQTELGLDLKTDLVKLREVADFVNNSTGRGSLSHKGLNIAGQEIIKAGSLESQAHNLSNVFFAPRLMASRVKMWNKMLNPLEYVKSDPVMRKEALKSLFGVVGTGALINSLVKLGGGDVSLDPTNSDFWKGKINETRIDPSGGFQQYLVAASKLMSGKSTSSVSGKVTDLSNPKYGQSDKFDIVERFFTNKLAPIPSFVYSMMRGKEFDGMPFDAKKALLTRTVPIVMQDLYELSQEDPKLLPVGLLPVLGVGMQTYGR